MPADGPGSVSVKIFSLLVVLSALIFILWGFCPMVLLSILAFLCPHTWSHDENVYCPHLYHVITWTEMGSYTLIVGVLKYCLFWGFCPMVLLSILAFLCPPTWSHDENVYCPHLHHVITWTEMGSCTLTVGVLKYFLFWSFCPLWFLSFGAFVLCCFFPLWLFSVCPHDRMTRTLIFHTCIMCQAPNRRHVSVGYN